MDGWVVWGLPLLALIVGILGGFIGAYVGMRIGLARLETQATGFEGNFARIQQWQRDKERSDREFRIDEYSKAITGINTPLWSLVEWRKTVEKDLDHLMNWKDSEGLAYIRAVDALKVLVDEHEKRIVHMYPKVFRE